MTIAKIPTEETPRDELDTALERLDRRLLRAIGDPSLRPGQLESFRGLYLSEEEVRSELADPAGTQQIDLQEGSPLVVIESEASNFAWLRRAFYLTAEDLDILLIALAPEIDLRYERAYAFLQDDVTRKRPTVDLALNLLAGSAIEKRQLRRRFSSDASLRRFNLVQFINDPSRHSGSFLARRIDIDPQVLRLLLGEYSLDDRLTHCCELNKTESMSGRGREESADLGFGKFSTGSALKINLFGPDATNAVAVASDVATPLAMRLLVLDARAMRPDEITHLIPIAFREAWFGNAILLIRGIGGEPEGSRLQQIVGKELQRDAGVTLVESGADALPWTFEVDGLQRVELAMPSRNQRKTLWETDFEEAGLDLDDARLESLADAYRLSTREIHQIVNATASVVVEDSHDQVYATASKLAKELVNSALRSMTTEIQPKYTWDDIVLPDETRQRLQQICDRVTYRHKVLDEWGFGEKLSLGKGTNALFSGPSGTGKTMAAEVIASELDMPLFRIDLATVVSKYIGETEKNLKQIFHAAERANAVLFFDEADALFGKRSEVKDSHDRYANIEISYLLQMMEQYEGLSILATNLRGNLDDAFLRRLSVVVNFRVPEMQIRAQIWDKAWPSNMRPQFDMLESSILSASFTGSQLKNIAIGAAYHAAAKSSPVSLLEVELAADEEFVKLAARRSRPAPAGS